MKEKIAVLLAGFGGPQNPGEVQPFLQSVLKGKKIPAERLEVITSRYEEVGGRSPYNETAFSQKKALEAWLKNQKHEFFVYTAFRHSTPSLKEAFISLKNDKIEKVIIFVLSPFRSDASFGRYQEAIADAGKEAGAGPMKVEYTEAFHKNPFFIDAQSRRVEEALALMPPGSPEETFFLFSAHSIPQKMSDESGYADQFAESAAFLAQNLGFKFWDIAYQSRSGDPAQPWLGPDVREAARRVDKKRFKNLLAIPIGFTNDNLEILYDLDVDLRQAAVVEGLHYFRAGTVSDHPRFVEMMGSLVLRKWKGYV